jgi:glucose uptake protein GlcU
VKVGYGVGALVMFLGACGLNSEGTGFEISCVIVIIGLIILGITLWRDEKNERIS